MLFRVKCVSWWDIKKFRTLPLIPFLPLSSAWSQAKTQNVIVEQLRHQSVMYFSHENIYKNIVRIEWTIVELYLLVIPHSHGDYKLQCRMLATFQLSLFNHYLLLKMLTLIIHNPAIDYVYGHSLQLTAYCIHWWPFIHHTPWTGSDVCVARVRWCSLESPRPLLARVFLSSAYTSVLHSR